MKIKNIEELKSNINYSIILVFVMIFGSVLAALYVTHNKFDEKKTLLNKQVIISAGNIYKSNLSEKLSIIASSTVFLDYLRSGEITRKRLYSQFLSQMPSLKSKSISGMQLVDSTDKIIFDYGVSSPFFISLNLCYLNQILDPEMGDCQFTWKLYFRKSDLLNEMISINKDIKICQNCDLYSFIDRDEFGSFPIKNHSDFKFMLSVDNEKDYLFYVYFVLMTSALSVFGIWSWYRLNSILNNYIAVPIKNLTNCLKINESLDSTDNISEIQYLINEINIWKSKINKNAEMIGKIAAQLAHDVRSPLSTIDMIVKSLTNVPENCRVTLRNATQRISDIANNFLSQYKMPKQSIIEQYVSNEFIPSILECMVSEKRSQYIDRNIKIELCIEDNACNIFSFINPTDFNRLLSNLINNSVEAVCDSGHVIIKLIKLNKYLRIEIIDDGCGIDADLLPKIMDGGVSVGKKNGYGLGLSHAINRIKKWHGDIDIKSNIGVGTEIGIKLPLSDNIPDWFKLSLSLANDPVICILDDETQTYTLWKDRLNNIKSTVLSIQHFFSPDDMHKFIMKNLNLEIIYLIDYDLGDDIPNGLDVIEKFNLTDKATLVTNRYDDIDIQKKAISLGIKIIPKNLILHMPIC